MLGKPLTKGSRGGGIENVCQVPSGEDGAWAGAPRQGELREQFCAAGPSGLGLRRQAGCGEGERGAGRELGYGAGGREAGD